MRKNRNRLRLKKVTQLRGLVGIQKLKRKETTRRYRIADTVDMGVVGTDKEVFVLNSECPARTFRNVVCILNTFEG